MGKIRVAKLGDAEETELKRRADARRQTKKSKKAKVEGVGLHGGERVSVVEGTDIKPEFKKLAEEVEEGAGEKTEKAKKKKTSKTKVRSKRYREALHRIDRTKLYEMSDAVALVKETSLTKFDGTVELHVNLNTGTIGEKKDFRGSVRLPHATGKTVRVAIADDAILEKIQAGKLEFDVLVAHPSMMPKLARVAKILGPRGLMPNPKNGTVSPDPEKRAKELSAGEVNFKSEPGQPILHLTVGKVSAKDTELLENIAAYLDAIGRSKILRATLSATMGPGIRLRL
ncbi:50S ribosomal protein L1 [Patescibacteria group bacterium]|nr:50S ribosomal protein L1 [Patescibacteria group bacterium]